MVCLCTYGHSEWNHGFLAFTSLLHQKVIQSLALPKARFSVISHSTKLTIYLYWVPLEVSSHGLGGGQELRETCHLSNSNIRYSQIQPFYQVKEKLTDSCLHRCSPKSHDLKAKWMFIVSNSNIYCYYTNYLYKIFFNWKERKNLLDTFFSSLVVEFHTQFKLTIILILKGTLWRESL